MSANILFINEEKIKTLTGVSDKIDAKQIRPVIKTAQDMYIQPALGSALYLRLQTGVNADNLTTNETILLDNYVTDCLVWYAMSELPMSLSYQFFSKGVLQKTAEESDTPSRSDLELISNEYKRKGEFYKQRMINYLRENCTLFAQYLDPGNGLDVIFPELKAYTCPIYLGGSYAPSEMRLSGMNSSSGNIATVSATPSAGVSTFEVAELSGKVVLVAVRGGLAKGITSSATANTQYLQINGTTVTLPTGDLTQADELFIFTYR